MGIVYVLTNSSMPGLVKIGKTSQDETESRVAQLYTTGVPVPFDIEYACEVSDADAVESALHQAFDPNRINPRREFFQIEPDQAIAILNLLDTARDVTSEVAADTEGIDEQDVEAAQRLRRRRPNLNFEEMGIAIGSTIRSARNDSTAEVVGPRRVLYEGVEMSLTAATRLMMNIEYDLHPAPCWTFDGTSLREIYNETYGS
jgi:T5orf172 domain-containing protein